MIAELLRSVRYLYEVVSGTRPVPEGKTMAECAVVLAEATADLRTQGAFVRVTDCIRDYQCQRCSDMIRQGCMQWQVRQRHEITAD